MARRAARRRCSCGRPLLGVAPVIAADDLLVGRLADPRTSPRRSPRRSTTMRSATSKTSARLWLITTTPSPRSRRRLISSSTWRGLRDAERGGRLVEDHHLGVAEQRAGDRHRLALAAGERADLGAHAAQRRHRERVEQLDAPSAPCAISSMTWSAPRARLDLLAARGRGWRRRRGCRTAPGPGRRSRCPRRGRVLRGLELTPRWPSKL